MSAGIEVRPRRGAAPRIGLDEAIFCAGKSAAQIAAILAEAEAAGAGLLLTRLDAAEACEALPPDHRERARLLTRCRAPASSARCAPVAGDGARSAIVTAGTSDVPVAREAARTLRHAGHAAPA